MSAKNWRTADGEAPVSYLREMIAHPASLYGLLGAVTAGAILSIPLGLGLGALPILGYAAAEGIAALFVPSSPVFRAAVDRRKRDARRRNAESHLLAEIERRDNQGRGARETWDRMRERLGSLRSIAAQRGVLGEAELETLDDATVDFLGMWLARLVMYERRQSVDVNEMERRVNVLERQREAAANAEERRRIDKALADLNRVIDRHRGMRSREAAAEAAMISMADTFEEVYQRVMTMKTGGDATRDLHEAVERLRMEERIEEAVDLELDDLLEGRAERKDEPTEGPKKTRPHQEKE